MVDGTNPPLSYEASATTTHPHIATTLPPEVVSCLKNSRFVCYWIELSLTIDTGC